MRYSALATDYDGTLAADGKVASKTIEALDRVRAAGRQTILVTGRELPDLLNAFPEIERFDHVVAENGGVLYCPRTKTERLLASAPPAEFIARLAATGVQPLSIGRTIVSTREAYGQVVGDAVRECGLALHVVLNKGAVMVLQSSVNKATGLCAALAELELAAQNVAGIGDAENDHIFLSMCGCAVAVANALPSLKQRADWVTDAPQGKGVVQLIDRLIDDDLASLQDRIGLHRVAVGPSEVALEKVP